MHDRPAGSVSRIAPLRPWQSVPALVLDSLPVLDPPTRITVTEAAEAYVRVPLAGDWKPFDRMVAPYIVEPADMTQSRRYGGVVLVGPSQSAKTMMLQTVAAHAVTCAPDPVLIVHMDRNSANAWVEDKLNPMIENSPALFDRLGKGRDDSTLSRKRFKGMGISIGIPVPQFLSSRTARMVLLTDYDHMPQVLGPKDAPEGSPWALARQRIKTYRSRGGVVAESSPAFPVTDETWRATKANPHEFPPVLGGIVRLYNEGTRGRWYWCCPDCDGLFEPRFDRLHYDATLEPAEAGETALMACPHCGSLIAHRHKTELNRAALRGRGGWLHESGKVGDDGARALVPIGDSAVRAAEVASYAVNGAAAAFATWSGLVANFERARRTFDAFNDDTDLAQVTYTEIGVPYLRKGAGSDDELSIAALRDHRRAATRGVCPSWTAFVTVSIDVQGSSFAVLVTAWGVDGTRTIVERVDLSTPPADAPSALGADGEVGRKIDPGRYGEDWEVLKPYAERAWPVQGSDFALRPIAIVVDFNGPPGSSDHAERFWRACRKEGQGGVWFLSMGRGGFHHSERVWLATPERGSKGKKARSIKLLNVATDRLKDTVLAALGRFDDAAGAYPIPDWIEDDRLGELLSERRGPKGYDKKPGVRRNETLDLSVQAQAVAEHKGLVRLNPDALPAWAVVDDDNPWAVRVKPAEPTPETAPATAAPAVRHAEAGWIPHRDSWI